MGFLTLESLLCRWESRSACGVDVNTAVADAAWMTDMLADCIEAGRHITLSSDRATLQWLAREVGDEVFRLTRVFPATSIGRPETSDLSDTVPPRLTDLRYPRNPHFVGRGDVIAAIRERFMEVRTGTVVLALTGMGGIGKTQTALEYAYRYRAAYRAVFWIAAESFSSIEADYGEISIALGISKAPGQHRHAEAVEAVRQWFLQNGGWLLIIDNADDKGLLESALPRSGDGHILVTTQASAFSLPQTWKSIALEGLSLVEGFELMTRRASLHDAPEGQGSISREQDMANDRAVIQIVNALQGHPLALSQAAAYIAETRSIPADYVVMLHNDSAPNEAHNHSESQPAHSNVESTIRLALGRIKDKSARQFLQFCSFLAPEPIPMELFHELEATEYARSPGGQCPARALIRASSSESGLQAAIRTLASYSLLVYHPEQRTVSVHGLVQGKLRREISARQRRGWIGLVLAAVDAALPDVTRISTTDIEQHHQLARLIAHVEAAVKLLNASKTPFNMQLSNLRTLQGDYAVSDALKAGQFWVPLFGADEPDTSDLQSVEDEEWREQMGRRLATISRVCTPQQARTLLVCVFLLAHYWWDSARANPDFGLPLLAAWDAWHDGTEDRSLSHVLRVMHDNYPSVRLHSHRAGPTYREQWRTVLAATEYLCDQLSLNLQHETPQNAETRFARAMLDIYRAEALRFISQIDGDDIVADSDLWDLYRDAEKQFSPDKDRYWLGWLYYEWAAGLVDASVPIKLETREYTSEHHGVRLTYLEDARKLCDRAFGLMNLTPHRESCEEWDLDMIAATYGVLADADWNDPNGQDNSWGGYVSSICMSYALVGIDGDQYSADLFAEFVERTTERIRQAADTNKPHALDVANFFHFLWRSDSPLTTTEIETSSELQDLVYTGQWSLLAQLIFPPPPDTVPRADRQSHINSFALNQVLRELLAFRDRVKTSKRYFPSFRLPPRLLMLCTALISRLKSLS
jgi:hypothetical protein